MCQFATETGETRILSKNHVISRTFIHHLYMELKISHGSILFWRAGAPPPPQAPPPHQYASVDTTHPQERLPSQSPFQDSSTPPPSLSLSLSLSHTWCTRKPTVYLHHHASRHLQAASKHILCITSQKIKLIIWYLPFYCTLVVVMLLLSFLFLLFAG